MNFLSNISLPFLHHCPQWCSKVNFRSEINKENNKENIKEPVHQIDNRENNVQPVSKSSPSSSPSPSPDDRTRIASWSSACEATSSEHVKKRFKWFPAKLG